MNNWEKISSLHDDLETPFEDRNNKEYDISNGQLERKKDGKSVVERISQFGITPEDLHEIGIDNSQDITETQYAELIAQTVKEQYDTIFASIFTHWENMPEASEQMKFIERVSQMYEQWGLRVVGRGEEVSDKNTNLIISLEGADVIKEIGDIQKLYDAKIRLVTLQYNRDNSLANNTGLTALGTRAVKNMFDLGMSVDLSHVNPKARDNVLDIAQDSEFGEFVSYTHGATVEDIKKDPDFSGIAEARGISQKQLERIIKMKGIVGLGVTRPFYQTIDQLAERVDAITQLENGPQALGIGTDFGGVPKSLEIGIGNPSDVLELGNLLSSRFGIPDAIVKNIIRHNAHEFAKRLAE